MEQTVRETLAPEFVFGKRLSLRDFADSYSSRLPVAVRIYGGFCSPDEGKFTFSDDDVSVQRGLGRR